jgi:hypothetical protein
MVIALSFTKAKAQQVVFGAKIGINYASVTGDNSSNYDPITAVVVGAVGEFTLTEKLAFQPEILFSRQGFRSPEYDLKLKYVNFPLLAKYYITKKMSVEAGPQVGFRLVAIAENSLFGQRDVSENVKGIDLGVNAGLGYKLESGINFSARYYHGFSNINQYVGPKINNQNAVIQVAVGYLFF